MSNQEILKGILMGSLYVYAYLEQTIFPKVKRHVKLNSGNDSDAWSLYNKSLEIIYEKIINRNIKLTSSFTIYFFAICKNQWLVELEKRKEKLLEFDESKHSFCQEDNSEDDKLVKEIEEKLFWKHVRTLNKRDQIIIKLMCKSLSEKEIYKKLNYCSYGALRKRVHDLRKLLSKKIEDDPEYRNMKYNK